MSDRDLERLLALVERTLGREWVEIAQWLRGLDDNSLEAIEARLLKQDVVGVIAEVEAAAKKFAAETHSQFVRSGRAAAKWLDNQPKLDERLIRFDIKNDRAIAIAKRNELELVQGFRDEANQVARQITRRAIAEGTTLTENPRKIAREFRDSISLAPHQEASLANYRRELASGDYSAAMQRELRDARSDKMLRRLMTERRRGISDGQLSEAQIDKLANAYRKRQIAWRAELIARTEGLYHVHAGMMEAFQQAIDRGDLKADELVKEWIPGPRTKHARIDHRSSFLTDQRPKFGEAFVMGDGTLMQHPGDRNGGAKHNAHCRCTMAVTLSTEALKRRATLATMLRAAA